MSQATQKILKMASPINLLDKDISKRDFRLGKAIVMACHDLLWFAQAVDEACKDARVVASRKGTYPTSFAEHKLFELERKAQEIISRLGYD